MKFRHELKYAVHIADYYLLRNRIKFLMQADPNAGENGTYIIRSLYFDNPEDKALREKLDGVSKREKFRIRMYNGDEGFIRLEKKSKQNGLNSKESDIITKAEALAIISLDFPQIRLIQKPLAAELYRKMQTEGLRAKTIVEYTREAYVYNAGNVRVTFDSDIKTGIFSTDFFGNPPLVKSVDTALLEVKYDEFIPEAVAQLLQLNLRAGAFSKYAACRIYG